VFHSISASEDTILAYKKTKEFAYIYYLDSLLKHSEKIKIDTISPENMNRINPGKGNRPVAEEQTISAPSVNIFNNGFVKLLLWVLAIGFIAFILYKLFLGESFFRKQTLRNEPAKEEIDETPLEASGYDRLINEAIQSKNFRLATRYLYLQTLQSLNQHGAILFSIAKTNYQYVRELQNKSYQNEFSSLTLNYEYVWYGDFNINEELFTRLQRQFNQFHKKI
jgi:hypothetical protein